MISTSFFIIAQVYSVFGPKCIVSVYKKWLVLVQIRINLISVQLEMNIIKRELVFNVNMKESDRVVDAQVLFFCTENYWG